MNVTLLETINALSENLCIGHEWIILCDAIAVLKLEEDAQEDIEKLETIKINLDAIVKSPDILTLGKEPDIDGYAHEVGKLFATLNKIAHRITIANDSTWSALKQRGDKFASWDAFREELGGILADKAMLEINQGLSDEKKIDKKIELEKQLNEQRNIVFANLLNNIELTGVEHANIQSFIASNTDNVTSQLIISALTLSCLNHFDLNKFFILEWFAFTDNTDTDIRCRSLVGMLLTLFSVPKLYEEDVKEELRNHICKNALGKAHVLLACKILHRTLNQEKDAKMFKKNLMANLRQATIHLIDHLDEENEEDEDYEEDFPIEDEEDDNEIEDKMEDIFSMIEGGADIYFHQFKKAKSVGFFHSLYNWFMPFHLDCPEFLALQKRVGEELAINLNFMFTHSSMCSNDLYSLATTMPKDDKQFREIIKAVVPEVAIDNYKKELQDLEEEEESPARLQQPEDSKETEEKQKRMTRLVRSTIYYIQDLVRFFRLSPMVKSFVNPLEDEDEELEKSPLLAPAMQVEDFDKMRLDFSRFLVKRDELSLIPELLEAKYPYTLETHFMLAKAYALDEEFDHRLALPHIAYLLDKDPYNWTFVKLAASAYMNCKHYDEAIKCLEEIVRVKADQPKMIDAAKLMLGNIYVEATRYDDAAKILYEFYYNDPEDGYFIVDVARIMLLRKPGDKETCKKVAEMTKTWLDNTFASLHPNVGDMLKDDQRLEPQKMIHLLLNNFMKYSEIDHSLTSQMAFLQALAEWGNGNRKEAMEEFLTSFDELRIHERNHEMAESCTLFDETWSDWMVKVGVSLEQQAILSEIIRREYNRVLKKEREIDERNAN